MLVDAIKAVRQKIALLIVSERDLVMSQISSDKLAKSVGMIMVAKRILRHSGSVSYLYYGHGTV